MKKALYLVMENTPKAHETLEALKANGYNATLLNAESLRHALDDEPADHHFINLRHLENLEDKESALCIFILDEEKVAHVKQLILDTTDHFKEPKGFYFVIPLDDYCGSI